MVYRAQNILLFNPNMFLPSKPKHGYFWTSLRSLVIIFSQITAPATANETSLLTATENYSTPQVTQFSSDRKFFSDLFVLASYGTIRVIVVVFGCVKFLTCVVLLTTNVTHKMK